MEDSNDDRWMVRDDLNVLVTCSHNGLISTECKLDILTLYILW